MVGAVVVANGTLVGSGYHRRAGGPHAEIIALQRAGSRSRRATLYCTLEPCCHSDKRTAPCVPAVIDSGVSRVVVAMRDPHDRVNGRGIQRLRRAGITVDVGCLGREAAKLNEGYVHWVKTGRPFVVLKAAMTLDGQIATASGESQWITGVSRVVVAMRDPHDRVNGRGIQRLRRAGITVDVGCLGREAAKLNEGYVHWVKTGRPFVVLKAAMTLDGQIATASGESQWITGVKAREHVHRLRSRMDAIAVGVGTVLKDDPRLTVRLPDAHAHAAHPPVRRIIFDSRLRSSVNARVFQDVERFPTIVATTGLAASAKIQQLRSVGADVLVLPRRGSRVSLRRCLRELGKREITSLLVEGGSELSAGFLRAALVNRLYLYVAPVLLGGRDAKGLIGGLSPNRLNENVGVRNLHVRSLGEDLLITGDV